MGAYFSSGDINRLMMMMVIVVFVLVKYIKSFLFRFDATLT
jgi:hypothetical protein